MPEIMRSHVEGRCAFQARRRIIALGPGGTALAGLIASAKPAIFMSCSPLQSPTNCHGAGATALMSIAHGLQHCLVQAGILVRPNGLLTGKPRPAMML